MRKAQAYVYPGLSIVDPALFQGPLLPTHHSMIGYDTSPCSSLSSAKDRLRVNVVPVSSLRCKPRRPRRPSNADEIEFCRSLVFINSQSGLDFSLHSPVLEDIRTHTDVSIPRYADADGVQTPSHPRVTVWQAAARSRGQVGLQAMRWTPTRIECYHPLKI